MMNTMDTVLEPTTDPTDETTTETKATRKRKARSMAAQLDIIRMAIDNAIADEALQARLLEYGYTPTKLQQGRTLLTNAQAKLHQKLAEDGAHRSATQNFRLVWERAEAIYLRLYRIARAALVDQPGVLHTLGLNGARKRLPRDMMVQASQFYTNALGSPAILEQLAVCGISDAQLREGQSMLTQASDARTARARVRGDAHQMTIERNDEIKATLHWYRCFITVARMALVQEPQWLEKLGVTVK